MELPIVDLMPGPLVFAAAFAALVEVAFYQQMAQAAVQTDSFVPLNKVVTINCWTADTRPPLV